MLPTTSGAGAKSATSNPTVTSPRPLPDSALSDYAPESLEQAIERSRDRRRSREEPTAKAGVQTRWRPTVRTVVRIQRERPLAIISSTTSSSGAGTE